MVCFSSLANSQPCVVELSIKQHNGISLNFRVEGCHTTRNMFLAMECFMHHVMMSVTDS